MKKRILLEIAILLTLGLLWTPTFAWVHPDGSQDSLYERYGPRAEELRVHLHTDAHFESEALKRGEIDILDWPLPKSTCEELKQWPYNETIQVVNYGPEYGLFILDLNSNNNQYLGNPPDPAYPNPVADRDPGTGNPKIGGGAGPANDYNPMSSVYMRRAIAYLVDRPGLIADPAIGADFGYPMYTTMPPAQPKYLLEVYGDPTMPWAWSYDPAAAAALLDANGFPVNSSTGYRFWDRNGNGNEEADEYVELIFYIRSDHPGRNMIGTVLMGELAGINLRVNDGYSTSSTTFVEVMVNKNFHMYTGGWSLGVDPDHLILWSWDYYWHPGFCYNYGGHNDADFNEAAEKIMYAATQEEAVMHAMTAQNAQARQVLGIPLYCSSGNKAFYKTNTGGNPSDLSEGETWENSFVNTLGHGIDNSWTFTNMHTSDTSYGRGMVIDWGFMVPEIKQLNPLFASWLHDWNVLSLIYEPLLVRSPVDLGEFIPWLAESYDVGTYFHPIYGNCTKVRFTLRPEATWHDGTPLTTADIHFTFVEMKELLEQWEIPDPWFCSWWWRRMIDLKVVDPYNFEILTDLKSVWAVGWLGGTIILPKHVWKPILQYGPHERVTGFAPDPDLIGTGPWRFREYYRNDHVLLMANRPGCTVQTNLPNSTQVTSPRGYHRYHPISAEVKVNGTRNAKINCSEVQSLDYTLRNLYISGSLTADILLTFPNGSFYSEGGVVISALGNWTHQWTGKINGLKTTIMEVNITNPSEFQGSYSWSRVFYGTLITHSTSSGTSSCVSGPDTTGSTFYDDIGLPEYPYKDQLPTPDFKVDIRDIAVAAKAFGSYPGHSKWDPCVDINDDKKVDIRDIASIAKRFGWSG